MIKAFVFGKYLPFHKGHEAMIKFALTQCDFLSVLICCSNKENISGEIRKSWIVNSFPDQQKLSVEIFDYREEELPNTSVSSHEVSKIWAAQFKILFPDHTLLITSELYGEYVADYMKIKHIPFDQERNLVPISASAIRNNLSENWKYLSDKVKYFYVRKIVILGSESTGKTTLTKKLAQYFKAASVLETAREIIKDSQNFSLKDLYEVATSHAEKITKEIEGEHHLLIIDTDVHITQSYANYRFGKMLELTEDIYRVNKGDLYLYLCADAEYIQDGTRLEEQQRNLLDQSHRDILKKHNVSFYEITGSWDNRYEKSVELIKKFSFPS